MQEVPTTQLHQHLPEPALINRLNSFASGRGVQLYLVGGCVRDLLLNRPITDFDFALEQDALPFARAFADILGAAFVTLEEQLPTARAVIRETGFTLDFAQFRGRAIEEDLCLRDLNINAIGIELSSLITQPSVRLIDPCNGVSDLKSRQLHFPSERVVLEDPLRLLRVYRFAAQLDFSVPEDTVHLIRRHKNLLSQVKPGENPRSAVAIERIRDELIKILDVTTAAAYIRQMDDTRLLSQIFPEIESMRGVQQEGYESLDLWEQSLRALQSFEEQSAPNILRPYQHEIQDYLNTNLVYGLKRETIIKLALIFRGIAKPVNPRTVAKSVHHESVEAKTAVRVVKRLRLGGKAAELMSCLVRNHLHFTELLETPPRHESINRFLKATGRDWLGVLLISYADLRVSQENRRKSSNVSTAEELMKRVADRYFLEILPMMAQERLITGDEIMDALNLKPGAIIGEILKQVEELQFDGKIHTPKEALVAARRFLEMSNHGGKP